MAGTKARSPAVCAHGGAETKLGTRAWGGLRTRPIRLSIKTGRRI
ncbi:MAG: hypothetical protein ACK52Z_09425 [Acidobacteriota bacterium]